MSEIPKEIREAFAELSKWQFQNYSGKWSNFGGLNFFAHDCKFRRKVEKPLTVDEALELGYAYMPTLDSAKASCYQNTSRKIIKAYAEKGMAYATKEGAKAHAQRWLDNG